MKLWNLAIPVSLAALVLAGCLLNASAVADAIRGNVPAYVYSVELDADGRMIWRYGEGDSEQIWRSEPGASGWDKFVARITSLLPVEGQL